MSGPTKILFIAPSGYPLGGVQTWLDYLMPGLQESSWSVTLALVCGTWHDPERYLEIHPWEDVVLVGNETGSRQGRINSLVRVLSQARPEIVVSVNIADTYPAVASARQLRGLDTKVVMALHAIQPDLVEDAERYADVIDAVVCTNHLAAELVHQQTSIDADRVHYAPYGVDESGHSAIGSSGDGVIKIAWVGRFEEFQKRIHDLVPLALALDKKGLNFEILLAGSGEEEQPLRHDIEQAGLGSRFNFVGVLSKTELLEQVYLRADMLLVTSYWETGPITIWEAMSHALPVVTSSYVGSGLEGALQDFENCRLFSMGSSQEAAECITSLADRTIRTRLIQGGLELVRSRYSKPRSIVAWDEVLRLVLNAEPLTIDGKISFQVSPSGRLDRVFGVKAGEVVRRMTGRVFRHASAGGEWPHSHSGRSIDDPEFWKLAQKVDQLETDAG